MAGQAGVPACVAQVWTWPFEALYRSVRFDLVLCKALYCKIQNFTDNQIV